MRLLERDEGIGFGEGADIPGAVLITASLMLGVYTIVVPAADQGWTSAPALGLTAVSLALLVAFIVREATARNPLIPLRIFRSRNVSGAIPTPFRSSLITERSSTRNTTLSPNMVGSTATRRSMG